MSSSSTTRKTLASALLHGIEIKWRFSLLTLFIFVTVAALASFGVSRLLYKRPFTPKIAITTNFHPSIKVQGRYYNLYRARGRRESFVDFPPYGTLDQCTDEQNGRFHDFYKEKPYAGPPNRVLTPVHERNFEKLCRFVDRQSKDGSSESLFLECQRAGRPKAFDFSPKDLAFEE